MIDLDQHNIIFFARDYVTFLKVASAADLRKSKITRAAVLIAIGAFLPTLVICIVPGLVACLLAHMHYLSRRMLSVEESQELQDILPLLPNRFSYKELSKATKSRSRLMGAGCVPLCMQVFYRMEEASK